MDLILNQFSVKNNKKQVSQRPENKDEEIDVLLNSLDQYYVKVKKEDMPIDTEKDTIDEISNKLMKQFGDKQYCNALARVLKYPKGNMEHKVPTTKDCERYFRKIHKSKDSGKK